MVANDFTSPGYVAAKKVRVPFGMNRAARRRAMLSARTDAGRRRRQLRRELQRARGF